MKLAPSTVYAGQPVSLALTGDTYDEQIESVTPSGKTITLAGGRTARWNAKRQRFQIGKTDSRGYAMLVINRVPAKQDPHH